MAAEQINVAGEVLVVHRFGTPGARPKVYLQGALHADEVSATMALAELVALLQAGEDQILGEIVVVPHCNPIGAKQFVLGRHSGRFSLDGKNFNRAFPQIGALVVDQLKGLGPEQQTKEEAVRIGAEILHDLIRLSSPVERLQATLVGLAWGSDVIVDVHADMEATLHLYTSGKSWPVFQSLAQRLEIPVVILADQSADAPFDEVHSDAWFIINGHLGGRSDQPLFRPAACTLELRGLSDVTSEWAASDSRALRDFLVQLDAVTGTSESVGSAAPLVVTLDAVEAVKSEITGVVIHLKPLGAKVAAGDRLARLHDPFEPDPVKRWQDVIAATDGVIFARWHQRMIQSGMAVVKIASLVGAYSDGRARLLD